MQLHQLVEINEDAIVANAVSFSMMQNREDNQKLCKGFVFNYDTQQPKASTLGVLDALYWGFHSPSNPNIHLMVQDYGKGKTHFALTVANFFKLTPECEEVQGIFKQIEYATSSDHEILRHLQTFKERGRYLVICLSGDQAIDLRQQFLQEITKILREEGREDAIASHTCKEPLDFLNRLTLDERLLAEQVLEEHGCDFDVNLLIKLLEQQADYEKVRYVIEICQKVKDVTPNFQATVDIEAILIDLLNNLCSGENRCFQGILILVDELYNYLQRWSERPVEMGDTALQNITNVCERFRDRVSLLCLTQIRPQKVNPPNNVENYNRLVSRLEIPSSTYEPAASLELVLKGLIRQKEQTTPWQTFEATHKNTLSRTSNEVFEKFSGKYYKRWNWDKQKFYQTVGIGCFPLHPLTTYLLCNLNFTQGRTVLDFIKKDQDSFREFIASQPIEQQNGKLNYVYPVTLVDAFEGNFSNPQSNPEYPRLFADYTYAADKIKALSDAETNELNVLKGLFLFYASASSQKLAKPDREPHEEILSVLTGIDKQQVKRLLLKLHQERRVISSNLSGHTYSFYSGGIDPNSLDQRIREELAILSPSLSAVEAYCDGNRDSYVGGETIPTQFIEQNQLRQEDWRLQNRVFSVATFRQKIKNSAVLKDSPLGIVAYVIASTQEQARNLVNDLDSLLNQSPIKEQVVVAVATQPATSLAIWLQRLEHAKNMSDAELGEALSQLKQQYEIEIDKQTRELFDSCNYHCHLINKLPNEARRSAARLASELLSDRYPLVPPVAGIDKMAVKKGSKTNQMIGFIAKRLLEDDLRSSALPDASYENTIKPVFVQAWRLLKLQGQRYTVCEPEHPRVKTSWQHISNTTALDSPNQKVVALDKLWNTLSSPPYGYNEYTFTILLAAWLSYHHQEVYLRGKFGIPDKRQSFPFRTAPIKEWANTNIFDKAKDFIHKWVLIHKPYIVRHQPLSRPEVPEHLTYDQAQELLDEINNFLTSTIDSNERDQVTAQQQKLQAGIKRLNEQIAPTSKAQSILKSQSLSLSNVEALVRLYPNLQQSLSSFKDGDLTISPSEQQTQDRDHTLHQVIERIGEFIESEAQRYNSLKTPTQCEEYKADLKRLQKLTQSLEDLPTRLESLLGEATRAASNKLTELREQESMKACLAKIQQRFNTLSTNATQADYHYAQADIANLAGEVPNVMAVESYQVIVQELENRLEGFERQLEAWETQYSPSLTKREALNLNNDINQQQAKFSDEASQARISGLQRDLNRIILEQQDMEIENQIIDLFRQLSRNRRPNLLKRLTDEELDKTTEELDG